MRVTSGVEWGFCLTVENEEARKAADTYDQVAPPPKPPAGSFGHPEPSPVRLTPVKGKAILVSGHDMQVGGGGPFFRGGFLRGAFAGPAICRWGGQGVKRGACRGFRCRWGRAV